MQCEACSCQAYGLPHTVHAHCRLSSAKNARQQASHIARHQPLRTQYAFSCHTARHAQHQRHQKARGRLHTCHHSHNEALPQALHQTNGHTSEPLHHSQIHFQDQAPGQDQHLQATHDDHCHDHCHAHGPRNKYLEGALRSTGILQLAEALQDQVWVSVAITALLAVAALAAWTQGLGTFVGIWAHQGSVAAIYFLAGIPEVVDLCFNLLNGQLDTHVLMTLACLGTLAIGSAFEGALLLVLFNVSHTVEHVLADKAKGSLTALFDQIPQQASLVGMNQAGSPDTADIRLVPTAQVAVGSTILVRPGQQVPLDGKIVYGEALVSSEHLTGEALPVRRSEGEEVLAGALNHDGLLVVRSSSRSSDSTPARIAKLTQEAQARRPQLHRWLDRLGEAYVRCVLAATAVSFVALRLLGVPALSTAAQRGAIYRSIGLLTTASPCALVLVPLAYVAALAAVTKRGVIMRGSSILDALAHSSTIAFDKTGTLTTGHLSCSGMVDPKVRRASSIAEASEKGSVEDVNAISSMVALSQRATHPVSRAAAALGQELHLPQVDIHSFKAVSGKGVQGTYMREGSERHIRFGSPNYAAEVLGQVEKERICADAQDLASEGVVSVLADVASSRSQNGAQCASTDDMQATVRLFTFTDTVHPQSKRAISQLQSTDWTHGHANFSFTTAMLTGDNATSASRIAKILGIANVQAALSPQQKLQQIETARAARSDQQLPSGVIMVGDGINDAPALAAADVGVAVASSPTEAASLVADIVLLRGDGVAALPFILRIAHRTQAIIKQNVGLALAAILALSLPVLSGAIPLWLAVALHEGSTLLVALNSLRLLYAKDDSLGGDTQGKRGAHSPPGWTGRGTEIQRPLGDPAPAQAAAAA